MTLRLATEADLEALKARIKGKKIHQYPDYPSREPDLGPSRPIKKAMERKAKYRNHRFRNSEGWWHSDKEYARWGDLKLLQAAGQIHSLRRQVRYEIVPSVRLAGRKRPPVRYLADFVYVEMGKEIVEDSKGFRNPVYMLKRHLMKAVHGIDIKET
jgi:hypothetical protein